MTTTPTETAGRYWLRVANETEDPLSMIGAALCGLLEVATASTETADSTTDLVRECNELEQLHDAAQQKIDDTLLAVKKSTSKLADQVRAILEPVTAPTTAPVESPDGAATT